jgi:hypothetical protein
MAAQPGRSRHSLANSIFGRKILSLSPALLAACLALAALTGPVEAQQRIQPRTQAPQAQAYENNELVDSGHRFFGSVSRGIALTIEEAVRRWGQPNGYILGQALHPQCGRPESLLAGAVAGL